MNTPDTQAALPGPTDLETILGGVRFTVHFRAAVEDGHAVGGPAPEKVFVKQFGLEQLDDYEARLGNELKMIELFCGKPDDWAKTLTLESQEHVINEGERINRDFFARWKKRKSEREGLMPSLSREQLLMLELLKENPALIREMSATTSASAQPSSPPPAGLNRGKLRAAP